MLLMEQAKLPPPMPESRARAWNTMNGVSGFIRAMPVPSAGIISNAVVRNTVLRPPAILIMNDAGIRSVAPDRPAIADRVKSCSTENGKPRFFIWVVIIPHISQMAKPISRLGMEIHRLRVATRLPSRSQKSSFSTSQCSMSALVLAMVLTPSVNVPGAAGQSGSWASPAHCAKAGEGSILI